MLDGCKRKEQGFTLVENLLALMVFSIFTALALSTLFFFNQIQDVSGRFQTENQRFEKLHLYFQRQIESGGQIYVHDGKVYLQDMESPKYYNDYQLKPTGMLYRIKTTANLKPIGGGESSQLEKGIESFSLTALTEEEGHLTGNFLLRVVFKEEGDHVYEAIIHYPGGFDKIKID